MTSSLEHPTRAEARLNAILLLALHLIRRDRFKIIFLITNTL